MGQQMKTLVKNILLAVLILSVPAIASADEEKTSDRCALCHEQETKEWAASSHAQAIDGNFMGEWERQGKKWECLVCHTSQYDRQSGTYSHEGVSCESCHGVMNEKHPDEAKMALPVTSEVCANCHSLTYGEWRISGHGQKGIRCFDCHKMHQMNLRKEDPDQMCGTCHAERLKDFSHATHHIRGVQCISCHMPEVNHTGLKIEGTGARGHTFGVGAETCTGCHREMVHQSHENATLEEEVAQLKAVEPVALEQQLGTLQEESAKQREALQANHRVFMPIVGLAFLLGGFFGYALPRYRSRKQTAAPEEKLKKP
jgi:hypothetical protein